MKPDTRYIDREAIEGMPEHAKIEGVTGFILAGGASSRMGGNKALLEVDGSAMITRTYRTLTTLFHEVGIVTNSPLEYDFLLCRKVPDIYPGCGSIAGLHSALAHSSTVHTFITACDMPFLDPAIIRSLCDMCTCGYDAVIPYSERGHEPLHALYASTCRDLFENAIRQGERKIQNVLDRMNIRKVAFDEVRRLGGQAASFMNVNTPEEYEYIRTVK